MANSLGFSKERKATIKRLGEKGQYKRLPRQVKYSSDGGLTPTALPDEVGPVRGGKTFRTPKLRLREPA